MKTAFIFPGQGSQKVGMARELAEAYPKVMAILDQANEILDRDLKKILFEGPDEALKDTHNTQPALYVCSMAILELVKEQGWKADAVAGHSLGEYSALAAVEAIAFNEGLLLVQARADAMVQAGTSMGGSMAAVLGLEDQQVVDLCAQASEQETVQAANFNCPGQVVVSGHASAVEKFCELAKQAGAKRVIPLLVSGAFHSKYMQSAAETMRPKLEQANWKTPAVPVYANVSGQAVSSSNMFAAKLVEQISAPVMWTQTIRAMRAEGIDRYLEIGCGKVLSGLVKKINPEAILANVDSSASFDKARQIFDQQEKV